MGINDVLERRWEQNWVHVTVKQKMALWPLVQDSTVHAMQGELH